MKTEIGGKEMGDEREEGMGKKKGWKRRGKKKKGETLEDKR